MAGAFCSHCGRPVPAGATFCPSCGAAVGGAPLPGTAPPVQFAAPPGAVVTPMGFVARSVTGPSDRLALHYVVLAAILGLVYEVLSLVSLGFNGLGTVASSASGTTVSLPAAEGVIVAYLLAAAVFAVIFLYLFHRAFAQLGVVDPQFRTPSGLTIVAIVGILLVYLGLGLLVAALVQASGCPDTSSNSTLASCLFTGSFWGGLAALLIGAIVALVGYIGLLIGIWRLGSRYNDSMFKIGAVLLIIPVLNVIGLILILIGARDHGRRAAGAYPAPPGSFG